MTALKEFTKVVNSCVSLQCADVFTAGLDERSTSSQEDFDTPPPTLKERTLGVKKKHQLSGKALSDYRFVFQRFDTYRNGKLDNMELRNIFHYWKEEPTDGELQLIVEKYDEDQNGFIEFPELVSIIEERKKANELEEDYFDHFRTYDTNRDGFISQQNLMSGLERFDYFNNCDLNELKQMMTTVNRSRDGDYNYRDFVKLLRYKGLLN